MYISVFIIKIKIISTSVKKVNKKYDGYPDVYPRLEVNIKFERKAKFEKGVLHCAKEPDLTSLRYCNSAIDCPCGMYHCHNLISPTPDGKGVCTPGETTCASDGDCKPVGDERRSGKLGVRCVNQKCQYMKAVIMA